MPAVARLFAALAKFIIPQFISGAAWGAGYALFEFLHNKGAAMFRTPKLLFHPKVTFSALLVGLATLLGYSKEIQAAFGSKGLVVVIACAVLYAVCAYGRSPASAVDNNTPPK